MLSIQSASILSSNFRKLAFMTYGKRLKQALEKADKPRAALATELGVSVQAVGQVITGGRSGTQTFTAGNNVKAAKFLHVDPHWLATGDGEMHTAATVWPFSVLTPDQLLSLPSEHLATVEKVALDLLGLANLPASSDRQAVDTRSSKLGQSLTFDLRTRRKTGSGNSNRTKAQPRKSGGG